MSFLYFYGISMNTSAETLSEALFDAAQNWPHQISMCADERHWTWLELYNVVEQFGYWQSLGSNRVTPLAV